jgi:hypothetical protein
MEWLGVSPQRHVLRHYIRQTGSAGEGITMQDSGRLICFLKTCTSNCESKLVSAIPSLCSLRQAVCAKASSPLVPGQIKDVGVVGRHAEAVLSNFKSYGYVGASVQVEQKWLKNELKRCRKISQCTTLRRNNEMHT